MISLSDNEAWRRLRLTPLLSSSKFPAFSALNPNRPLDYYALTNFGINPTISRHGIAQARLALLIWLNEMVLFVICLSVYQLQWNPIAPSKRKDICSKT